jgi:hypothetical protein
MVLILVPFWIAFHLIRLAVMLVIGLVAGLIVLAKALIALYRWNQARRAQLWADTHRYPLSLPDLREATPLL